MQRSKIKSEQNPKRLSWAKHQKRWFGKWHLYVGIIAGAIVAFVGVIGSILVFQDEIDRGLKKN
ncbi:PepSY domain-containing protein [Pedobacter borealis]|uniref:PepSY domain-containing protein n=1 Tax=Pedobacter borealis TaxID=475254 RepID=UPI0004938E24|nr:PepSY-associated TM helix domain-containing protein [Pedobacter borealis]